MHASLFRIAVAAALACTSGNVRAMIAGSPQIECHVVNGGKLSKESGGEVALCRAIERAFGEKALTEKYFVEVTVLGSSRMSVQVQSERGQKIAEQKYGSMDRDLTNSSFKRFADGLAAEVSKTGMKNLQSPG